MSTDIKPGMEGRAVRDTASMGGTKIPQSTVVTVTALPAEPHLFIGGNGERMGMTLRVDDFLFVPVYGDATPAPLDPSKVKAGDTVTLSQNNDEGAMIEGAVQTIERYAEEEGAPSNLYFRVGGFLVGIGGESYQYSLTAHQPAPEPEPVGPLSRANVLAAIEDRLGETGSTDPESNAYVATNVVMDLLTGLVVIDPAAARKQLEGNGWGEHEVADILHHLGIEAP